MKKLVLVTLADRVSGLLCLLLLLCGLVPWVGLGWEVNYLAALAFIAALLLSATILIGHHIVLPIKSSYLAKIMNLGLAVQLLQLACTASLLIYVGLPLTHFFPYLAVFLLSSVSAVLPLSIGGLGAREATFYYCMKLLGLNPTLGVVVSSCFFFLSTASSLIGALYIRTFSSRQ